MKLLGATVAISLLAGCAGYSAAIPTQTTTAAQDGRPNLDFNSLVPDVTAPPKCKGQKQTKYYASVSQETIKEGSGASVCVPAFGGWGGALQFPGTYNASYTVSLTSSTKTYKGGLFPPGGSKTPIFYVQIAFNGFPGFYPTVPKGGPLESTHLTAGQQYTVEVSEYFYGLGWSPVGSCYQVAKRAKDGNGLAGAGTIFEKVVFREMKGILEVYKGELVSNQC